ncbi:hypothetical protein ACVWWG_008671 [Bradyrhizobium sp. LB7.2]
MKPSAVMPQEANFSGIGGFGNCLFGRGAPVIRAHGVRASAWWTSAPDGAGAWAIPALGLGGGLHDLLLDQA